MNRRQFLMSTLATFALTALPKLTLSETIPVSQSVKDKINPQNKLGFGFMRLPLKNPDDQTSIDYETLNKMVDTFMERGFTYFDTAWMYMGYESEIAIRESLVKRHPRDKFTVASKLPAGYLKSAEDRETIFNKQLEKTGLDYFDYYLVHNVNATTLPNVDKHDCFGFIARKKKEGKIKNIGFSFHDKANLLEQVLKAHPEVDFVQLQINYIDWDNPSIQSRKCYEIAQKYNKPVVVMEPVKGGSLAMVPPVGRKNLQGRRTRHVGRVVGDPLRRFPARRHDGFKRHEQHGTAVGQHVLHAKLQTAGRRGNAHDRKSGQDPARRNRDPLHGVPVLRRILPDENRDPRLFRALQRGKAGTFRQAVQRPAHVLRQPDQGTRQGVVLHRVQNVRKALPAAH